MKRILQICLASFLLFCFFSIRVAASTDFGGGYYRVEENLQSKDLVNGASFSQDLSWTDVNEDFANEMRQIVSILETPINNDIKVVTWAMLSGSRWVRSPVTTIARDYELKHPGYKVIAAVNGDFFDINGEDNLPYAIEGAHVSGGHVYKKTAINNVIGISSDSDDPLLGNGKPTFNDKMTLAIYNENDEIIKQFPVDKINDIVLDGEVGIYYANWNNQKKIVPISAPNGFVVEDAEYAIAYSETDFYGSGVISKIVAKDLGEGEFAIISKNDNVTNALDIGTKIRVQYDLNGAWENIDSISGVRRTLIYDGEYIDNSDDTARHPRTMIGRKANGNLLLVVADGRAPQQREGVTHQEMSTIMHHYGAVEAYNLDGGGSSTMIILENGEFKTMNYPSGGSILRPVSNAVLIVVKVPEIECQFNVNSNRIEVSAQIVNNRGIEIDELYFGLGEDIRKLVDGKLVFTNLPSNTKYNYDFYRNVNGVLESLTVQGVISTAKQAPNISASAAFDGNDLVITLNNDDIDKSIERVLIYLDGKAHIPANNMIRMQNYQGNINTLDIAIEVDLQDGRGRHQYIFDLHIDYDLKAFIKVITSKVDTKIRAIYE